MSAERRAQIWDRTLAEPAAPLLGGRPIAEKRSGIGGVTVLEVASGWADTRTLRAGTTPLKVS